MQGLKHILLVTVWLTVLATACAAPAGPASTIQAPEARASRTLTMAVRDEVTDLAPKLPGSSGPNITRRLFNAAFTLTDAAGVTRPYLAQSLPQLNTDSWRVSPDGKMETKYQLRDGLTWQDGTPLTAQDFALAFRVYRTPGLGFSSNPEDLMDAVLAPDARTVTIQWKSLYAQAGVLGLGALVPLPRHLLEAPYAEFEQGTLTREAFLGRPFWTVEYVGAGPYRITGWVPGSHLEGEAFAGHALGRAKIDRVVIRVYNDENAVLATVLAGGQVDYTNQFTLRFEHIPTLRREWEAAGKGTVLPFKSSALTLNVQARPDTVGDPALLDVRVRRAIAHTLDRQALNEGLFEGLGFPTESFVPDTEPMYAGLDRVMSKHPPDPRRAEQLMGEAGFTRDAGGLFADATGRRYKLDHIVSSGPENERGQAILADSWRRVGFDVVPAVLSQAEARDPSSRHTFKGLASRGGGPNESHFTTAEIGSAANRWSGDNRGGWTHPEYERLFAAFNSTLDAPERQRLSVQMMALVSEQLMAYPLYFTIMVRTWVAPLQGPDLGTSGFGLVTAGTTTHWNIHEWEFRS